MRKRASSRFSFAHFDIRNSPFVDVDWYRATYTDISEKTDPVEHFIRHGLAEDRAPNRWMDPAWYYAAYPDVAGAGASAVIHYLDHGCYEGRDPGPWFSTVTYLNANPAARKTPQPFLHFLAQDSEGGDALPLTKVNFLVPEEDLAAYDIEAWRIEFQNRGFEVHIGDEVSVKPNGHKSPLGHFPKKVRSEDHDLTISFEGAFLSDALAQSLGPALVLVINNPKAAKAVVKDLGDSLSSASSVTSSRGVASILRNITGGAGTTWYPEPMWPAYVPSAPLERSVDIMWRFPYDIDGNKKSRRVLDQIIRRLSKWKLRIIIDAKSDGASALAGLYGDLIELRADWSTLSCLHDCYASARLALITPVPLRETEITGDVFAALAAGVLPILDYAAAPDLLDLLGQNVRVPFYKSLDELEAIVSHYLDWDDERAAYAAQGHQRVHSLPTYATRIGELMIHLGRPAPRLERA